MQAAERALGRQEPALACGRLQEEEPDQHEPDAAERALQHEKGAAAGEEEKAERSGQARGDEGRPAEVAADPPQRGAKHASTAER